MEINQEGVKADKDFEKKEEEKKTLIELFTRRYEGLTPQEVDEKAEQTLDKIEAEEKEFEDNVVRLTAEAKQNLDGFKEATERIHDLEREIIFLKEPKYGIEDILPDDIVSRLSIKNAERIHAYSKVLLELEAERAEKATVQA